MLTRILLALALSLPTFGQMMQAVSAAGPSSWLSPKWQFRKAITINANGIADVANFPLYVPLSGDADLTARANPDGSDVRYTASDGVTLLTQEIVTSNRRKAAQNGGWTWFNEPRVLRFTGTKDQTYFSYIDDQGSSSTLWVAAYNHADGTTTSYNVPQGGWTEVDDHDNPSLLRLSDNRLAIFYQSHGGAGNANFKISTNPEDITAWGAAKSWPTIGPGTTTGHAYSMPFRLSGVSGSDIFVFFRSYPDQTLSLATTTQANLVAATPTWDATTYNWVTGLSNYPYFKFTSNGTDTIFAAGGDFPGYQNSPLYFAKLVGGVSGSWYTMGGTLIRALSASPVSIGSLEQIYDPATDGRAWVQDITIDGSGYPVIVFTTYPGGTGSTQHYWYARWTGAAWSVHQIVDAGTQLYVAQPFYPGCACISKSDPSIVYLSTNASPRTFRNLERWVTADNGANWTSTVVDSSANNYRPACSWGGTDGQPLDVLYMSGSYTSYGDWSTNIMSRTPMTRQSGLTASFARTNVASASAGRIYMYYGNSSATDVSDGATVWSGWNVMASLTESDIGVYSYDSVMGGQLPYGLKFRPSPSEAAGKVGRSLYYPNAGGGPYWPAAALNQAGDTQLTLSAWVKTAAASGSGTIASNFPSSGTKSAFTMRIGSSSKQLECYVETATPANFGGAFTGPSACTSISDGNWHFASCKYDASGPGWTAIVDGTNCTSGTLTNNVALHGTASGTAFVGWNASSSVPMNGYLQRFGLARSLIPDNTIKVMYWNQNSPATSLVRGASEHR